MAKPKFDPNAAFKSIIGITETPQQEDDIPDEPQTPAQDKLGIGGIVIEGKDKEETRSRRVPILLKPSVYNMAKKKCDDLNISLGECINQFLEAWSQK